MWLRYWTYLCDRCRVIIQPDDLTRPSITLEEMHRQKRFYMVRSRKGSLLHYCSEECMKAHFHPGKGTPSVIHLKPWK